MPREELWSPFSKKLSSVTSNIHRWPQFSSLRDLGKRLPPIVVQCCCFKRETLAVGLLFSLFLHYRFPVCGYYSATDLPMGSAAIHESPHYRRNFG